MTHNRSRYADINSTDIPTCADFLAKGRLKDQVGLMMRRKAPPHPGLAGDASQF